MKGARIGLVAVVISSTTVDRLRLGEIGGCGGGWISVFGGDVGYRSALTMLLDPLRDVCV